MKGLIKDFDFDYILSNRNNNKVQTTLNKSNNKLSNNFNNINDATIQQDKQ